MQNLFRRNIFSYVGLLNGKLSLRIKLTIAAVGVSLVFLGPLTYYNYQNSRAQLALSVSNNLRDVAQIQAAAMGDLLVRQINLLQSLGGSKTIQDSVTICNTAHCGDVQFPTDVASMEAEWQMANAAHANTDALVQSVLNNSASTEIATFRESFPDNMEVFVTNQYGLVIAASNRTIHYSYANADWWRVAYNNGRGAIYIGQPELLSSVNQYVIVMAVPIYSSGQRQVIGVLNAAVRLLPHRNQLASAKFGQTGQTVLLFQGSQLLDIAGRLRNWPPATLQMLNDAKMSEVTQMPLDQNQLLNMVSQAPVSTADPAIGPAISALKWRVIASIQPSEAFASVDATALANFLIGLGILGASLLLALALTQYLTTPIIHLTAVAEQVRAGNLNAKAKVETEDEIGILAQTFNQTTSQLSDQINNLERRVSERTQDLEKQTLRLRTAAEVTRDASSARNLTELLERSGQLILARFNFYHVGIFLLDDNKEYAVLRASPTEAGRKMMENGHRLKVGEQGIVGRVSATGQPRIALDAGADPVHFNNPLLPETRSEMALPLKSNAGVIGVLDAQSEQPQAFTQDDIDVLQVMADQLAAAIERTRLLQQVEDNLKELETAYAAFTQKSWVSLSSAEGRPLGYRYNNVRMDAIRELPNETKEAPADSGNHSNDKTASIPIRLRGQTLGFVNIRFQGNSASQETIRMAEQTADRLASALENARLLEETRQRAQRDAMVAEMTGRLRSTLDLETILRTAAQELQQAFQLREAEIRLGLPDAVETQSQPKEKPGKTQQP